MASSSPAPFSSRQTSWNCSRPGPGQMDLAPAAYHAFGADHEIIDGIGVAPDYYLPLTAQDLSTGHDPGIAKALTLLRG